MLVFMGSTSFAIMLCPLEPLQGLVKAVKVVLCTQHLSCHTGRATKISFLPGVVFFFCLMAGLISANTMLCHAAFVSRMRLLFWSLDTVQVHN
jgi:hypothetical protein